jgi:hypothetical protein
MRLVSLFFACATAEFLSAHLNISSINALSPVYNNPNYFELEPGYEIYYNDTFRVEKLISHFSSMLDINVYMFQEISLAAPCLTNANITLLGNWDPIRLALESLGYVCSFGAHLSSHWSKYYDYEDCSVFNAYRPTGNALCLKISNFENISFFSEIINEGSTNVYANATFQGVKDLMLSSIHFDSDVAGIRREEFEETFFVNHPPRLDRPLIACGDYNTFWTPANLMYLYATSGYTDPLYNYALAMGIDLRPSQPLTEGWYNSANHRGPIDHCLVPIGSAILVPQLWKNSPALYGYPNSTLNGVIDFQLWTEYPVTGQQGFDSLEGIRNGETLKRWGSDHYGIAYSLKIAV